MECSELASVSILVDNRDRSFSCGTYFGDSFEVVPLKEVEDLHGGNYPHVVVRLLISGNFICKILVCH